MLTSVMYLALLQCIIAFTTIDENTMTKDIEFVIEASSMKAVGSISL